MASRWYKRGKEGENQVFLSGSEKLPKETEALAGSYLCEESWFARRPEFVKKSHQWTLIGKSRGSASAELGLWILGIRQWLVSVGASRWDRPKDKVKLDRGGGKGYAGHWKKETRK